MVDIVLPNIDTLDLTSQEILDMTGWPEPMIEDYLTILQNVAAYTESITSIALFTEQEAKKAAQQNADTLTATQKRRTQLGELNAALINYVPLKGLMLQMTGANLLDPTIVNSYNVTSLTRTGVGTYQITVTQNTFYGLDITTFFVPVFSWVIAPSVTSSLYSVEVVNTGAATFDISVYAIIQGAGTTLARSPYDLLGADSVALSFVLNAGDGSLPPP